jgi:hypothetical protein
MAKEIATLASQMRQEEMLDSTAGVALSGDVRVLLAFLFFNVFVCVRVYAAYCYICVSCVHSCMFVLISRHFVLSQVCVLCTALYVLLYICPVYCYVSACIPDM